MLLGIGQDGCTSQDYHSQDDLEKAHYIKANALFSARLYASVTWLSNDRKAQLMEQGISIDDINNIAEGRFKLLGGNDLKEERATFAGRFVGALDNQYMQRYNIVVFKKGHPIVLDIPDNAIIDFGEKKGDDCSDFTFKYFVFKEGKVTNNGDGGAINWKWAGGIAREGNTIIFAERP